MFENYTIVFVFGLIGLLFALAGIIVPKIIAPSHQGGQTKATYESGVETIGSAWVQFKNTYYTYALVFIVFDVEAAFLFPALLSYREHLDVWEFALIALFLILLSLGIIYALCKKFLTWK